MQPTQNPIASAAIPTRTDVVRYVNCVDCGYPFDEPSKVDSCKLCTDYADSWGEIERDRYLNAHEALDSAETASDRDATDVEPVSRVLRDAVMYLCRHGWRQLSYYGPSGVCLTPPVCMVGALAMVCYGEPVDAPEEHYGDPGYGDFEAALAHLDLFVSSRYGVTPYTFNDTKGRNGLQVVGVLLKAADEWDRTNGGAA